MRYSPDNKYLVVPTSAGIVWIYETQSYQLVSVLEGHLGQIYGLDGYTGRSSGVEFSSDSKRMLSVLNLAGLAYLWDTQTWQRLHTFRTTSDRSLGRFWFSTDDKSVMMQNWFDKSVDVWDVETGAHIENIPIEDDPLIPSMPPSPPFLDDDGTYQGYTFWHRIPNSDMIAAWRADTASIHLFNVNTGEYLHSILCCLIVYPGGNNTLYIFDYPAFSPDGRHVAIAGWEGTIRIFDIHNRNTLFSGAVALIDGYTQYITSIAFSPDGETLATDSIVATLWDVETPTQSPRRLTGGVGGTQGFGMAFSPDGQILALATGGKNVGFIDVNTGLPVRKVNVGYDVVFSPNLKICAEVREGGIDLVDTDTGMLVHELNTPPTPTGHLALVNNETGKVDRSMEVGGNPASVSVMTFSPDGRMLAGGTSNGWLLIWDVQTGEQLHFLDPNNQDPEILNSLAFSPDGRILASGDRGGRIRLWDTTSGTLLRTILDKNNAVSEAWGRDKTPSHWAITTEVINITGVDSLAFSPDGNVLVSGGATKIYFWDVESGEHLQTLRGYHGDVIDLAFSPDGNTLASAAGDIVLLWEYDPLNFTKQTRDPRDVNNDGVINILDLVRVAKSFDKPAYQSQNEYADVNDDGVINILDLVRVASGF